MNFSRSDIQAVSSRIASKRADRSCILTVNSGSSSLRFALLATEDRPRRLLSGRVERIGENSHEVRRRICKGLEFLGIAVDQSRNSASAPLISTEDGRVAVRVIPTDEQSLIARASAESIPRVQAASAIG